MKAVTANGAALHYDILNPDLPETLVFVNSLGTDYRIWDDMVDAFPQYRIVRYDKRGHGLSDTTEAPYSIDQHIDDLSQLLDALEVDKAVFCGVSIGGMIAMGLAARQPHRVSRLILSNTSYRIGAADGWNDRIHQVETGGMAAIAEPVMDRWFSSGYRSANADTRRLWQNMLLNTPVAGYAGTCAALRDADLLYDARAIQCPTLCIAGSEDGATPVEVVRDLSEQISDARLDVLDGAGHLPCIEQPEAMTGLLRDFLIGPVTADRRFEVGMGVRRAVLGNAHVDRAEKNKTAFDLPFQTYITENAWGAIWSRPGLSRRDRSLLTIAMMASLGHEDELAMHIRASRNTGTTVSELQEVLLQVGLYAGVPAANTAIRIAKNTLVEMGESLD